MIICVNVSVNYSTEKAYAEMSSVFSPNNFHGRGTYRKSFIKRSPGVFYFEHIWGVGLNRDEPFCERGGYYLI